MTLEKGMKAATEATVNGLQEVNRLAELIKFQAKSFLRSSQAVRRKRTFCAGWIVVRRRRAGREASLSIFGALNLFAAQ